MDTKNDQNIIRYIIVVHGIGEQRKNETVLSVVNRFAEIRAKTSPKKTFEILTLGKATGQTGKDHFLDPCRLERPTSPFIPWMEFEGIPQTQTTPDKPFYGEKSDSGENLRFVDLCWADIMQQDYPHVGQKVEDWAQGLVGRLQHKANFFEKLSKPARILLKNIKEDSSNIDDIKDEMTKLIQENDLFSQFIQLLDDDLENKTSNAKNADELKEAWQEVKKTLDQTSGSAVENYPLLNFGPVPKWVLKILKQLAETLIFVRRLMSFRVKKVEDMIYNKFLGDVQLYGEFPRTRGRAVRRFHKLMWHIHTKHWELEKEREEKAQLEGKEYEKATPEYTILAHSLGTVMSMDALVSAHVDMVKRSVTDNKFPNLPFPDYLKEESESDIKEFNDLLEKKILLKKDDRELSDEEKLKLIEFRTHLSFLDIKWKDNVDSFITLGSPIDKYLVLWWLNYQYLNWPEWEEIGEKRKKEGAKNIKHFNYTDEQDPVGHALDQFQDTKAFESIFEKAEDRVFNRYKLPGVAHVKYWKDLELFQHIAHKAVDPNNSNSNDPAPKEPEWFKPSAYRWALLFAYFGAPLTLTLLIPFTLTWAIKADEWQGKTIGVLLVLAVIFLGKRVIDLLLWWRKVMREKAYTHFVNRKAEKLKNEKQLGQDIKQTDSELREFDIRSKATFRAKWGITLLPFILGALTIGMGYYWFSPLEMKDFDWIRALWKNDFKSNILLILLTGTLVFGYVAYRYHRIRNFFKPTKTNQQ